EAVAGLRRADLDRRAVGDRARAVEGGAQRVAAGDGGRGDGGRPQPVLDAGGGNRRANIRPALTPDQRDAGGGTAIGARDEDGREGGLWRDRGGEGDPGPRAGGVEKCRSTEWQG